VPALAKAQPLCYGMPGRSGRHGPPTAAQEPVP